MKAAVPESTDRKVGAGHTAPRRVVLTFRGKASVFLKHGIDRKTLYGFKRRIALDAQGRECTTAHLTRDGRLLFSGCTAHQYLDERGDVVEKRDLVAVDEAGRSTPEKHRNDDPPEIEGPIPPRELLDHVVTRAYSLEPESVDPHLVQALAEGHIFRVPSHDGIRLSNPPAFLLANDQGVFLLRAESCGFELTGPDQRVADMEEMEEEDAFAFDFAIGGMP